MTIDMQIIEWSHERNIIANSNPIIQFSKTLEEVNELLDAINTNNKPAIIDSLGDIYVTLVLQAEMNGVSMQECITHAYNEIKDRTGQMIDGKYVKESDL